MSLDVRDILDMPSATGERASKKKKVEPVKRPAGMHREVFSLLSTSADIDPPPLQKNSCPKGYKHMQKLFGNRKVRSWGWTPFTNSGRKDNLSLNHWRRCDNTDQDYPFSVYHKECEVVCYTDEQYNGVLQQSGWTRADTDHLMILAKQFDLRFIIMQDRWDKNKHGVRSVEDMKERYYSIQYRLDKLQDSEAEVPAHSLYDADHERLRKDQLDKLYNRTPEELEEEEFLVEELRKIEVRRKEREKKQQDLQRLIHAADEHEGSTLNVKKNKKLAATRKKEDEARPWRIPDKPVGPGVTLRSSRIKQSLQVGQKKAKLVEQVLVQLGVGLTPMPTEDITDQFNELRNDILFLLELKVAQESLRYEIETQKFSKEAILGTQPSAEPEDTPDTDISGLNLDEAMNTAGLTSSCNRKRRAALELEKVTSLIKKSRKSSKG